MWNFQDTLPTRKGFSVVFQFFSFSFTKYYEIIIWFKCLHSIVDLSINWKKNFFSHSEWKKEKKHLFCLLWFSLTILDSVHWMVFGQFPLRKIPPTLNLTIILTQTSALTEEGRMCKNCLVYYYWNDKLEKTYLFVTIALFNKWRLKYYSQVKVLCFPIFCRKSIFGSINWWRYGVVSRSVYSPYSSLAYSIPLIKDQNSFYEIGSQLSVLIVSVSLLSINKLKFFSKQNPLQQTKSKVN